MASVRTQCLAEVAFGSGSGCVGLGRMPVSAQLQATMYDGAFLRHDLLFVEGDLEVDHARHRLFWKLSMGRGTSGKVYE